MISGNANMENIKTTGTSPEAVMRLVLMALDSGDVTAAVGALDEPVRFVDHALGLEFTQTSRLTEFLGKARELFPDMRLQIVNIFESGEHAVAEWQLTATKDEG